MPNFISEAQIELALMQRLQHLHGYEVLKCQSEDAADLMDGSCRADKREIFFHDRVKEAALRLNKKIPEAVIDSALERLTDRRQAMSDVGANREIYDLLRDGIEVEFDDAQGNRRQERVRLIDFSQPKNNRYLAVSQLWVKGEPRWRRPDVLLYVNGIPLVFIELKNSNVKLETAHAENVVNYRTEIPQLFLPNAFCVLTNGIETKVGSFAAEWEYFFNWFRVEDEKEKVNRKKIEQKGTSIELMIEGLLAPAKLLDYVENFILYYKETGKIVAQNHQFLGVNRAYETFRRRKKLKGKLGVFWHTQGSGKSFSMIFYARKIFRHQGGNFTFVIVTDREDLDGQIYRNFLNTHTVAKAETAQPKDSKEMRKFLGQQKRLVFTLIHKFRWPKGKEYPLLSPRDDIVVIVDEAHRTQYKSLAENMRAGLPKAQYLAFTGTPLLGRDRKTNKWFGDYVSEYTFRQSTDDGATVPLFYEKRVPEVLIQNPDLSDEFYEILEDENLDDAQQEKLQKRFEKEIEVIKRPDRLEKIAQDIVYHFPRRGYLGKGICVSLDKFTAVRMYDKVQRLWKDEIRSLRREMNSSNNEIEKVRLRRMIAYMRSIEMAVIVSDEAEEEKKFAKEKLNIKPHRERMNRLDEQGHDVEYNFKDPPHSLQLVFVCAMWLTGFDAPTVSTLYLDKPMKDHTLMQTIARANRVTSFKINGVEKKNGEIIDYYNVFRNMKKALRDYAQGEGNREKPPVQDKAELFQLLNDSVEEGFAFCRSTDIALDSVLKGNDVFKNVALFKAYADKLLSKDDSRKTFNVYQNTISSLYEACKPEILGKPVVRSVAAFQYLRGVIDTTIEQKNIENAVLRVSELLDESLIVDDSKDLRNSLPELRITQSGKTWDLSKLDFEKLKQEFKEAKYKNIEIADLRAFIEHKLEMMLAENATRANFAEKFQEIVDKYNAGGSSNENYYEELVEFTQNLRKEDERHIREELSTDELELYDNTKEREDDEGGDTKGQTRRQIVAETTAEGLAESAGARLVQRQSVKGAGEISC